MPKAKPFPEGEEEEKTTIESQWEDEASTTVEQGDVADKIRSLGSAARAAGTNETNTGAGALDEPTVDDQGAQMSAITPVRDVARLQISQGNDAGQEIEVRPGKTYTIGRAIDNDVVLTDIAVSRKHFDLRFEDGAWVIIDRGSGNGTVVNGNLEDNPFMLANGDVIEIGNTVFRFDQPNAASRVNPQRLDIEGDEEEMSTVAGKPLRPELADIQQLHQPIGQRAPRPKTLPPPTPLRAAAASQPPPLSLPPLGPSTMPSPASTLPMAQMANRPPPGLPPVYNPPPAPVYNPPTAPAMLGAPRPSPLPGVIPTTLPGQGAPPPRTPQQMFAYPQASEIPPHSVHAQMMLIQTQRGGRNDASTAHVQPVPFEIVPQQRYTGQPQLTKRAKIVLIGIGVAVFTAVMAVAILKSNNNKKNAAPLAATEPRTKKDTKVAAKATTDTKATVAAGVAATAKTPTTPPSTTPPPAPGSASTSVATTAAKPTPAPTPTPSATTPTTAKTTTPVPVTPTAPPSTPSSQSVAKTPTPSTTTPSVATTTKPAPTSPTTPPPTATTTTVSATTASATPKVSSTKTSKEKKSERKREKRNEARREPSISTSTTSTTEVATTAPKRGGDPDEVFGQAERYYEQRKFAEAGSYLSNQSKKFDEQISKDMKQKANWYSQLGKAFSAAGGADDATKAYEAWRSALTNDMNLGKSYVDEIKSEIGKVAGKAALLYITRDKLKEGKTAMGYIPQGSANLQVAKQQIEKKANELYNEAVKLIAENPGAAKEKLKLILMVTDKESAPYKKATQKLSEV